MPPSSSPSPPSLASEVPRSTWHGAHRLAAGVAVVVLCIAGMVALPYWAAGRIEEVRAELRETLTPLEITLERSHREALGIANDVRGFWLTGDRSAIANLVASDAAVRSDFRRALDLDARSGGDAGPSIRAAETAYAAWFGDIRRALERSEGIPSKEAVVESTTQLAAFSREMERVTLVVLAHEQTLRDRATHLQQVERVILLVLGTLASLVVAYLSWLARELVRAQRFALQERDQLGAVLASVDSGILLLDRDLRVAVANERAAELLGVPLLELVGSDRRRLVRDRAERLGADPRSFLDRFDDLGESPDTVDEDVVELARPEPRTLSRYSAPVRDEEGAVLGRIEVYRDVTDALRRERELADANERKDRFVATLSHELRTPLTPILGWIELLSGERDPRKLAQGLQAIRRNVELEAQLVEDLLDLSRVVNQKLELSFGRIDLTRVLSAAVETVRHLAEAKGVALEVRLPEPPLTVVADEMRLIQVVWNLVSNAIKFTPQGGAVSIEVGREGERIRVSVEDEGEGIAPEFLTHVFKPFEQARERRGVVHGGLGVGLALARSLVELHGGEIRAESEGLGRGARFTFWVPVESPKALAAMQDEAGRAAASEAVGPRWPIRLAGPLAPPVSTTRGAPGDGSGSRVLVVEDNPDTLEAMRILLESWGYDVEAVGNASAALEAVRSRPPDAIVSDIGMPGLDGLVFAREVRQIGTARAADDRVLLVAITGFASKADRERALAAGFDAYLTKPIDFAALRDLLVRSSPARLEAQRT